MVLLPWTPPYDWAWMVGFLQARAVAGVERFHDGGYSRSFRVAGRGGLIHLAPDEEAQGLRVTLSPGLQPVAEICYARIGQLFDLACDPQQVARTLGDLAQARPGLRLPGALDAFEQAVRAVLGQLVSVAMAARLTGKVAAGWGEPLADAPGYALFPTPEALSRADPQGLKALGMPLRRAEALIHLARAALSGELPLTAPADIDAGLRQLQTLPGIGRWTANYFALRGWQAKDIFLPDDYLIKQRFPGMTPAAIARYARRWQPMRSYALLHIWYTDDWAPAAE
ncbi:TPA: DNA-3-methyladenine glycosylase 2 [Klebsiella quasipneumoniae subsp. similipneumoniae]|uniref:DNA-3-methyladenine glycosylase 2 n=1 Tax=Klebsiella quasipneumoniae TaxID=1463165 RepID=UPI0018CB1A3E|nr:DNA-3-methyladenine glycosylase 2 [Klebsiella quasipneumoniae]HBW2242744.1 DNA-3-methyladenine glycosylase 2 [Klebsiella quasipneumoniae subsp. similipneumoniae]ELA0751875.1 DNA-3-methyladenine glycosylase 2 [Klebsiella quasipneumoniae]MBG9413490.1 DNA-3-methyladenine glycosylase 2 [Klebsiella quasipneumoniae]HDH1293619.1 DNA-3-methyladenine glycosylase 2 [Klebsiella quasipneumoniae subsp. similipneumoniae]HDT5265541.1 DNA-3-methyladenine glycosylase 2 [Klebsiella quasipneumoniae subsp. sim